LKGASPEHEGPEQADRWGLSEDLEALAASWRIDPRRDLARRELSEASWRPNRAAGAARG
jgi:hypothetical protein